MKHPAIILLLALLVAGPEALAQQADGQKQFRYRGSISLADKAITLIEAETSHGVLVNGCWYFGAGAWFARHPKYSLLRYGGVFMDIQHMNTARPSSLQYGIKAGYCINPDAEKVWSLQADLGWQWKVGTGNETIGFNLGPEYFTYVKIWVPRIAVVYSF